MFFLYDVLADLTRGKVVTVIDVMPTGFKTRDKDGNTATHSYPVVNFTKIRV